ncbi:TauD/TfdA family dioxygenase [Nonomuraea rubra]|uniref:TauD/TfdA family dioxygenase n=1 Tax=Nonomuraea rubra TaxID=46180 RepID=UPI0033F54E08
MPTHTARTSPANNSQPINRSTSWFRWRNGFGVERCSAEPSTSTTGPADRADETPAQTMFTSFGAVQAPTTIGYIDDLAISDKAKKVLFEERFVILPDESHRAYNNSNAHVVDFGGIDTMCENPEPLAVLFGDPNQPYIRIDPYFMTIEPDDVEAREAFDELTAAMDEHMWDLQLASGDYCVIDNHRVVHGRKPFVARYDGTDRWLKRISVTSDLRKSRAARASASSRLML